MRPRRSAARVDVDRPRVLRRVVEFVPTDAGRSAVFARRANGEPLPDWHYLVSGSRETVHELGVSIRGRAISDEYVHPDGYDEHIVTWVE